MVAHVIAGGEPGSEWSPPAESARLRTRANEIGAKLQVYQLAASIHDADSVRPARAEALRLAQAGIVRDHFAPAVAAMLAGLAEFVRQREAVVRMLNELGAAGLDGGPVSMPWFPAHLAAEFGVRTGRVTYARRNIVAIMAAHAKRIAAADRPKKKQMQRAYVKREKFVFWPAEEKERFRAAIASDRSNDDIAAEFHIDPNRVHECRKPRPSRARVEARRPADPCPA